MEINEFNVGDYVKWFSGESHLTGVVLYIEDLFDNQNISTNNHTFNFTFPKKITVMDDYGNEYVVYDRNLEIDHKLTRSIKLSKILNRKK